MNGRRILFISPRQCWPVLSGAKLREYHFLRALARGFRITYVYFAESLLQERPASIVEHLPFCEEVVGVPKPPTYGAWNLMRGAVGKWPLPVVNYTSAEMAAALSALKGSFDLVHLDSIHMTRYTGSLAGVAKPVVYNWHNIESEAMRRHGAAVASKPKRLYAGLTARKLEGLEAEILGSAFGHVVCSEREREQLLRIAPGARIVTVENGVDTGHFEGAGGLEGPRRRIVFVGKMDYYPNIEAAKHFVERIWPGVTKRLPRTTLTIAGSDPVEAVKALGQVAGVTVTGTVPDLRPYYNDALAAIVPLRTGGGTRLKILEAMAAGVPVISTRLGAEGLSVEPGGDILFADVDAPEEWAAHLERLSNDTEVGASIAARALELVKTRYDWDIVGERLRTTYAEWLSLSKSA
ncbi:MAG TPA: glycosyltransferase [Bryobacteraceae bacterium]